MATFLPARSFTEEIAEPSRATSASLSPATSSTQVTSYGMFSGAERPRATGLEPIAARSTDPATNAVLMLAPESNLVHLTSYPGSAFSSQPFSLTIRSPLGNAW